MLIAEIESDLLEYADFEEVASVPRAKRFVTAAKRWLILRAESASNQSSSMQLGKAHVETMLARAQEFVQINDRPSRNVRFLGVGSGYR